MNLSDGVCKRCSSQDIENLEHLLYSCAESKKIWSFAEKIMQNFLGKNKPIEKMHALSGVWQSGLSVDSVILNMVYSITRHHIWKIRCKGWYGGDKTNSELSVCFLKNILIDHIHLLIFSKSTNKQYLSKLMIMELAIEKLDTN